MTHILLSNAAVGSIINVPVNGTIREFILVHNGSPNSSIYDASCNGVWLLGKECCKEDSWGSDQNIYEASTIHQYLNGESFAEIDSMIQTHVKTVKIPYRKSGADGTDQTGANGLETKAFIPSMHELGHTHDYYAGKIPVDGACLAYFLKGDSDKAVALRKVLPRQEKAQNKMRRNTRKERELRVSGKRGTRFKTQRGKEPTVAMDTHSIIKSFNVLKNQGIGMLKVANKNPVQPLTLYQGVEGLHAGVIVGISLFAVT